MGGCGLVYEWHGTQCMDLVSCLAYVYYLCIIVHEFCGIWYMYIIFIYLTLI